MHVMKHTLACFTFFLAAACASEEPERNAPPIAEGYGDLPHTNEPLDMEEDTQVCYEFASCTSKCRFVEFGSATEDAQVDCIEACSFPATNMSEDLLLHWAYSCAGLVDKNTNTCSQGTQLCEESLF